MAVPIDLRSGLASAVLVSSLVALGVAILMTRRAATEIDEELDWTSGELDRLGPDIKALHGDIQGLQAEAAAWLARASALGSAGISAGSSRQKSKLTVMPAANPRYAEFLELIDEWSRQSELKIQGAAATNRKEIASLIRAEPSKKIEESFTANANNLLEYAVIATDTRFRDGAPEGVDAALAGMARLACCELISPTKGAAWDRALHELVSNVPRGGNRAGTIARVELRGLRSDSGKIRKAKVVLYDD